MLGRLLNDDGFWESGTQGERRRVKGLIACNNKHTIEERPVYLEEI